MNQGASNKSQERLLKWIGIAVFGLIISTIVMSFIPVQANFLALIISSLLIYSGLRGIAHYSRAEKWLPIEATICNISEDWIDVSSRYSKLSFLSKN